MDSFKELVQELCPDGIEYGTLGDIGPICMCKRILKSQTTNDASGVPFYKIGTFGGSANAYISWELYNLYKEKYAYPNKGDVLISAAGTIGRTVVFDGKPAYFQDSNIVWISNDETKILNTFLNYYYQTSPWRITEGGTLPRLYNDNILKTRVPIPSKEIQLYIVSTLDMLSKQNAEIKKELLAELNARQKQFDYYRYSMFDIKEKKHE